MPCYLVRAVEPDSPTGKEIFVFPTRKAAEGFIDDLHEIDSSIEYEWIVCLDTKIVKGRLVKDFSK